MEAGEVPAGEFVKGDHVLVKQGTQEIWVQLLEFVKQNLYLGMACSRTHQSFGKVLELKRQNILAYGY